MIVAARACASNCTQPGYYAASQPSKRSKKECCPAAKKRAHQRCMCKSPPTTIMNSDLADAQEVKAAEESAWEILTGFSLPKYAVDSLTHYKNNPESFKNRARTFLYVFMAMVRQ